jgi:hypothetical protein
VFGVGIIGLGVIQAIRALGIEVGQLVAVDVQDVRLQSALAVGATAIANPRNENIFEAVAAVCGRSRVSLYGKPVPRNGWDSSRLPGPTCSISTPATRLSGNWKFLPNPSWLNT